MKMKYIHFVGIKGVGMTPIAIIVKEAGLKVTGSDIEEEFITDEALRKAGIPLFPGFSEDHITDPDLVITTGAHGGLDNVEVKAAREKGIQVLTAGEALGQLIEGKIINKKYRGISVAGTHGKTTTSAIIATILAANRYDPSYVIGTGNVGSLGSPGHFGKGKYFVVEADEYATEPVYIKRPRFIWQHPFIAVFTNIEFDHPDIYNSLDDIRSVFLEFANQIQPKGLLIVFGDDPEIKKLLKDYSGNVITYGFNPSNNYILKRISISGDQMFFWVEGYGTSLGEFALSTVGEHNALNALASIITCLEIGVSIENIKKTIKTFRGSKRRLEYIGELKTGAKVYDDYAHHPTEIKKTLQTIRKQYPKNKIICLFQPHTFSRTKMLFNDFLTSFESVDQVIITDIYASLREKPDPAVSAENLSNGMKKYHKNVLYLPTLDDVVQYLNKNKFRHDTIIISMGAGNIYTIHAKLEIL